VPQVVTPTASINQRDVADREADSRRDEELENQAADTVASAQPAPPPAHDR